MKLHPTRAPQIVAKMEHVNEIVSRMVREHHVNYNLCGYPELEPGERPTLLQDHHRRRLLRRHHHVAPLSKPFHRRPCGSWKLAGKVIDPKYFRSSSRSSASNPIGSLVRLDTNEVAVVLETFAHAPSIPASRSSTTRGNLLTTALRTRPPPSPPGAREQRKHRLHRPIPSSTTWTRRCWRREMIFLH